MLKLSVALDVLAPSPAASFKGQSLAEWHCFALQTCPFCIPHSLGSILGLRRCVGGRTAGHFHPGLQGVTGETWIGDRYVFSVLQDEPVYFS